MIFHHIQNIWLLGNPKHQIVFQVLHFQLRQLLQTLLFLSFRQLLSSIQVPMIYNDRTMEHKTQPTKCLSIRKLSHRNLNQLKQQHHDRLQALISFIHSLKIQKIFCLLFYLSCGRWLQIKLYLKQTCECCRYHVLIHKRLGFAYQNQRILELGNLESHKAIQLPNLLSYRLHQPLLHL